MDGIHRGLLKKFHTLCGILGIDECGKRAIIESYGVESSRDMDTHDLVDICAKLSDRATGGRSSELDRLRKRAMAAIGAYLLRCAGRQSDASLIKSIACRATGYKDFNKIPRERLRNIIYTFNDKVKDAETIKMITPEAGVRGSDQRSRRLFPGPDTNLVDMVN